MSSYLDRFLAHCKSQKSHVPHIGGKEGLHLDPHQQKAMELVCMALSVKQKVFSIVHSCGSGKTVLEANLAIASQKAHEDLAMENAQALILTTQRALIHSIREEIEALGLDVGIWSGGDKTLDRPVLLASIQSMQYNKGRLSKLISLDDVSIIIGDEADQYLTDKRRKILSKFPSALKIGLTATPEWPDGRDISEIWGEKIHRLPLKEGILDGINVPPYFVLFEADVDERRLPVREGDYNKTKLSRALKQAELQKAIPEVYESLIPKEKRRGYPTLVYVPSVSLVDATEKELKQRFGQDGVRVRSWVGTRTGTDEIGKDITDFNAGGVDILVLCEMGGRGVNLPRARCLIDGHPTLSPTKLEQRHGRVLRKIREESQLRRDGFKKPFALIAQIVPKSGKTRPYLLPDLLDCWPDYEEGRLLARKVHKDEGKNIPEREKPTDKKELDDLKEFILKGRSRVHVRRVEQVNVYRELMLRQDLPMANQDNFIIIEGERFGTATRWDEELGFGHGVTGRRLKGLTGMTGRTFEGRIRKEGYFAESLVRERCANLLVDVPIENEEGFFEVKGGKYMTMTGWSKILELATETIKQRLKGAKGMTGKVTKGFVLENAYFPEDLVRQRCLDLLEEMPKANELAYFVLENEEFRTIAGWSQHLKCHLKKAKTKLRDKPFVMGKLLMGRVEKFYGGSVIEEEYSDVLSDIPLENDEGFVEFEGEKCRSIAGWEGILGISYTTIKKCLKGIKGITGRITKGNILEKGYFKESIVREGCQKYLQEIPQANEEGYFESGGEIHRTITGWKKVLPISEHSIKKRLKGVKGITGKTAGGNIMKNGFYGERLVREKCKDLLSDLPVADEQGFLVINGERHATIQGWAKEFGVSHTTVNKRLKGIKGISGKNSGGNVMNKGFYGENLVREKCKDVLGDFPTANENNFFELDGEIYRTRAGWAKEFGVVQSKIRRRLRGVAGISGRSKQGILFENAYYAESAVRERCKD